LLENELHSGKGVKGQKARFTQEEPMFPKEVGRKEKKQSRKTVDGHSQGK
jgi:hypothetical protein